MSTAEEKTTFGVTIIRADSPDDESAPLAGTVAAPPPALNTKPSVISEETSLKSPNYESANPFSAFYQHPESRSHLEVNRPLAPNANDLEAGSHNPTTFPTLSAATTATQPKVSVDGRVKECTVWPTKQTLREKAKQEKYKDRSCRWWGDLSRKQKMWIKILIGLTIVALAVGLSVGISRAVGGGVWTGTGESHTIPKDD
ncbi:uncharacterized protein K452DRAFT_227208 [Aplosporella prunicola CBS 121167]|uniref:Uncharacterized protein n=1 Tax=Aplosporella prunicola CBS 121167 TaxID=1176127 RepID=A0A6A6BFK3_9PEZI|nr:uncharacterized protein K452DRAFT_227208 [Aplosporella prunicola CBS 121167]KAF2142163.1 hypothetical protein K452DRAFT_227208 [Aplosporella prunicola CBS 121167]